MTINNHLLEDITEISRGRTVKNAIANYGQYALMMVVGVFLQAYIIRKLGQNEYAIWPLILTCMGLVRIIPIAIGSGTGRFLAHALGRDDLEEVQQITTSLLATLLVIAGLYIVVTVFLSVYFEQIFDIPEGAEGVGPWAMLLAGLSTAIALPFGVFQGGLRAAQKFVVLNVLRSIILIAGLIFIVLGFTFGLVGLVWVAGVQLLLAVGEGVGFYMLSRRIVPWQRVRWSSFNWRVLKKVSNFSLLSLVAGVAGLLYWQTHNVVINKLLEPSLLTGYAVVVSFILYTFQLTSLGTTVLGPVATVMHAKGDLPRMGRLIYRANRTVVPMSICILFFIIIFGREILRVYLGPGYESYAVLFPILGISAAISATQNSSAIVPRAFGRIFTVSLMSLVVAILNVLLGLYFVLVLKWGLIGVAAGTAIVTIFYKWVFWPWYTGRMLGISYMEYLQKSSLAPIFHSLPFIVVILVLRFMNFGKGWIGLISVFMIAGSIQAIYMLMHGLEKSDRIRVRELMVEFLSLFKLVLKPKTNE